MTAVGCPLPWIPVAVARSVDSRPGRCGPVLSLVSRPPTFARRIGDGGSCTGCGEVLTVTELLGLE